MGIEHTVNEIKDLRPLEQVLAYLHRNNIPLTPDVLTVHLEQLKAELNVSSLPPDVYNYLAGRDWEYREEEIRTTYLKDNRVDVFLHPRFAPISVHSHSHFELKYLLSGSSSILVAGHSIMLKAGDLLFLTPRTEHMVDVYDPETLLLNIIITPDAAASAFPRIYFSENPISCFFTAPMQERTVPPFLLCHTGSDETIQHLTLDAYQACSRAGTVPSYLLCESFVEHLMLEVLASHAEDFELTDVSSTFPKTLFPILGYINDHCATANLATLSKVFHYSPAHLSRLIRQYTGKTFSELLRSARLTQASILLRSSDLSIQDVMLRTGYTGKAHFYRVFHEIYGMTPAQFRAQREIPL